MIKGLMKFIVYLGYFMMIFKVLMIYNLWFEFCGIDVIVVLMGVCFEDYVDYLCLIFWLLNIYGVLVIMLYKVVMVVLVDWVLVMVQIVGLVNVLCFGVDGLIEVDMFDGEGFVVGVLNKGQQIVGVLVLVVGVGGVGLVIVVLFVKVGVVYLVLFDLVGVEVLVGCLIVVYFDLKVMIGSKDLVGFDIVVNVLFLGMKLEDLLLMDVLCIDFVIFVGEVVMKVEMIFFFVVVVECGCCYQVGMDMLFEQILVYLDFFGFGKLLV